MTEFVRALITTETLEATAESLNRLSDALITNSKKAWQKYAKLESKCKVIDSELARLDDVQVLCKKIEAIAADLLCYTLGHVRHAAKDPK